MSKKYESQTSYFPRVNPMNKKSIEVVPSCTLRYSNCGLDQIIQVLIRHDSQNVASQSKKERYGSGTNGKYGSSKVNNLRSANGY